MDEIQIGSIDDVRRYRGRLAARRPEGDPALVKWRLCKRCVLMIVLAASFLIYYAISIHVEILSLPELYTSVPAKILKLGDRTRKTAP